MRNLQAKTHRPIKHGRNSSSCPGETATLLGGSESQDTSVTVLLGPSDKPIRRARNGFMVDLEQEDINLVSTRRACNRLVFRVPLLCTSWPTAQLKLSIKKKVIVKQQRSKQAQEALSAWKRSDV